MIYASRRVTVTAPSGVLDVHVHGGVDSVRLCASLTWICDVEQLYTDAALVLYTDASRRVAVTAQSGILDVHVHCVVERILSPRRGERYAHATCLVLQGR